MDEILASPMEAIGDLAEGTSVAKAGFGMAQRFPSSLLAAIRDKGTEIIR